MAMTWRNRVTRTVMVNPEQLLAHPLNYRIHPKHQQDALQGSLDEIGWYKPVIVQEGTDVVIDGHARVTLALRNGEQEIPVQYVDLTDDEANLALATGDPISALAAFDKRQFDALLRETPTSDPAMQELLSKLAENNGLYYGEQQDESVDDPGPQVDRAEELRTKWQTERGQLWEIPSLAVPGRAHRLLCGDSTSADDVARLMADAQVELVWTDPPYGVAVGDKNKFLNSIARSNRVEENLTNDTLDEAALARMLEESFDAVIPHCTAGAAWYVAAPPGPLHVLFGQVLKDRGIWRQTIQWVKNNATFSPLGVDYHWRAEPIFYGWLPNGAHRYYGGRQQDTVWEIDRPSRSPEHPTMKPVELVSRAIENSSLPNEMVHDPFLGSGTTMVAAEQTGRLCYAMEIEPKYVAVALERLAGMGLEPQLVGNLMDT